MLVRFFGSSFIAQYFSLALIGTLLWLPAFLDPQPMPFGPSLEMPLFNLVYRLAELAPMIAVVLAFLMVMVQAFILNSILSYHEFIPRNSLLAAFLYILLMSVNLRGQVMYPALPSLFLVMLALHLLFRMSEEEENLSEALSIPLLVALASMFYFPALLLALFLWISLVVFRIFKWREWVISLFGLLLPFIYLFTVYMWTGHSDEYLGRLKEIFAELIPESPSFNVFPWLPWGIIIVLMAVPSMFRILPGISSMNINLRKKFGAAAWLMIITLILCFSGEADMFNTLFLFPATIFISAWYSQAKKSWLHEVTVLLLLLAFALQFLFKT